VVGIRRRTDVHFWFFPRRQLVEFSLGWQFRSNIDIDDIWPSDVTAGKLRAIGEENSMFADDFCMLPSVTKQMSQRPVNTYIIFKLEKLLIQKFQLIN